MSLTIEVVNQANNRVKMYLIGRLDTNTAAQLEASFEEALTEQVTMLTLDLAQLEYVSSAGLRVLFKASKMLKKRAGHFGLMHLQPQIQKVLDIVKALPAVPIFKNEQEMDDYLDAMQQKVIDGED
ncbi:STAS domain-containing protein [Alkalimarinus sediminis]|uniref:Anti-sigma factor antagonist n=1 Tax=Alkalimarinus sediminis TaxID=1632866 RepID=A0A9E8KNV6_9ALTE|nr:STAS domain-containing protein [Alkalimarinus sediminis]UZW74768.1 STAS domain-containing protein [Alkalimarinus sediminis]